MGSRGVLLTEWPDEEQERIPDNTAGTVATPLAPAQRYSFGSARIVWAGDRAPQITDPVLGGEPTSRFDLISRGQVIPQPACRMIR